MTLQRTNREPDTPREAYTKFMTDNRPVTAAEAPDHHDPESEGVLPNTFADWYRHQSDKARLPGEDGEANYNDGMLAAFAWTEAMEDYGFTVSVSMPAEHDITVSDPDTGFKYRMRVDAFPEDISVSMRDNDGERLDPVMHVRDLPTAIAFVTALIAHHNKQMDDLRATPTDEETDDTA